MDKPTLIGKLEESLFNMGVAVENNEQRLYELEFMAFTKLSGAYPELLEAEDQDDLIGQFNLLNKKREVIVKIDDVLGVMKQAARDEDLEIHRKKLSRMVTEYKEIIGREKVKYYLKSSNEIMTEAGYFPLQR